MLRWKKFLLQRRVFVAVGFSLLAVFGLFELTYLYYYGRLGKMLGLEKPLCKDCNIFLVTLDSCGARDIQCYGYQRETMPNFCSLSKRSLFFQNAYANGVWTLPSHVSIFTGLVPSHHGVNEADKDRLSSSIPLLSEVLQSHGYATIFYTPDWDVLPYDLVYNRGVSARYSDGWQRDDYIDRALATLTQFQKEGKKTFVSFYTVGCHYPYFLDREQPRFTTDSVPGVPILSFEKNIPFSEPFYQYLLRSLPDLLKGRRLQEAPRRFIERLLELIRSASTATEAKEKIEPIVSQSDDNAKTLYSLYTDYYFSSVDFTNWRLMSYLRALYDQKLFDQDQSVVSKIVSSITNTDLKNNTLLIITAEHGDEFGQHEAFGHNTLYDESMKVPLLIYLPRIQPRTIVDNVQSVDIMPTLLDFVGIPHSLWFDGTSLVPLIEGYHLPPRILVSDGSWNDPISTKTLREGAWKLFVSRSGNSLIPSRLYNTATDPFETENVLLSHFDIATRLIRLYSQQEHGR